jgi:hypothetical protein
MPLSAPAAPRALLHSRDIALRGYLREDGLYDIEAHLTDVKTAHPSNATTRDETPPGEPIHGMWLRLTVAEDMTVVACEAASDHTPYAICPQAAPNFARLAGLRIGPGFSRAVAERVGGTHGCTHLRERAGPDGDHRLPDPLPPPAPARRRPRPPRAAPPPASRRRRSARRWWAAASPTRPTAR